MGTKYILKSVRTGKYLSNLLVVGHDEMFRAVGHDDAFVWGNIRAVHEFKEEVGSCVVVAINIDDNLNKGI